MCLLSLGVAVGVGFAHTSSGSAKHFPFLAAARFVAFRFILARLGGRSARTDLSIPPANFFFFFLTAFASARASIESEPERPAIWKRQPTGCSLGSSLGRPMSGEFSKLISVAQTLLFFGRQQASSSSSSSAGFVRRRLFDKLNFAELFKFARPPLMLSPARFSALASIGDLHRRSPPPPLLRLPIC